MSVFKRMRDRLNRPRQLDAADESGAQQESRDIGWTGLHMAAFQGSPYSFAIALHHGADVNARATAGETPLHLAALKGHCEIAADLLLRGAEVEPTAEHEVAPLHLAAARGHVDVARLLIEHGARVNVTTSDGSTPLDFAGACEDAKRRSELEELLRKHGARHANEPDPNDEVPPPEYVSQFADITQHHPGEMRLVIELLHCPSLGEAREVLLRHRDLVGAPLLRTIEFLQDHPRRMGNLEKVEQLERIKALVAAVQSGLDAAAVRRRTDPGAGRDDERIVAALGDDVTGGLVRYGKLVMTLLQQRTPEEVVRVVSEHRDMVDEVLLWCIDRQIELHEMRGRAPLVEALRHLRAGVEPLVTARV